MSGNYANPPAIAGLMIVAALVFALMAESRSRGSESRSMTQICVGTLVLLIILACAGALILWGLKGG